MSSQYKTFFFVLFFLGFMGVLSISPGNDNSISVENQSDVKQKLDSTQVSESILETPNDSLTPETKEVINEPLIPSEPQPQYKLPTLAQEAQIQKSKDIKLEQENIFDNAFAQNAKKPTVWDNMYTQGINYQPADQGGIGLEREMNRAGSKSNNVRTFSKPK
jgi:hypothetical protein